MMFIFHKTLFFYVVCEELNSISAKHECSGVCFEGKPAGTSLAEPGCKEYRKVDSVLQSLEEEERYEFTARHFLKKIMGFKTCITITQTI